MSESFWQALGYASIFAAAATSIVAAATAILLLHFLRDKSKSRYDEEHRRAEISEMRKSYEDQMKSLTLQLSATDQRWKDLNHLLLSSQRFETNNSKEVAPSEFLAAVGIRESELKIDPKLVLMLTPFSSDFDESYKTVVEACRKIGLRCVRGDEEEAHGDILTHILRLMVQSRLVIANIGSRNPNVYYELGIAHALDKPTILISETISDVPFDIQSKRILVYRTRDELENTLPEVLARALAAPTKTEMQSVAQKATKRRGLFLYHEPADGIGALRGMNQYLCVTNDNEVIMLPQKPYIFLRLRPLYEHRVMGDVETYEIAQRHLRPMQSAREPSWSLGRHESGTVAFYRDFSGSRIAMDASELFATGELWANDFYFLDPDRDRVKKYGFPFIPTGAVEEVLVDTLKNFTAIGRDQLKLETPIEVEVGLVGVQTFRLAVQPEFFGFSDFEGRILRNAVIDKMTLKEWPEVTSEILRPLFEDIYDAAGLKRPNTPLPSRKI